MHTVFISHAGEDREKARQLHTALKSRGIAAWMAPDDIEAGQDFPSAIQTAAETCQVLVLLVSHHSNASPWVRTEVQMAWEERPGGLSGAAVLPVLLEEGVEPDKPFKPFLLRTQWLDARQLPFESHLDRICARVEALQAGEDEPASLNPSLPRPEFASYGEARRAAGVFRNAVPIAWWVTCGLLPLSCVLLEYRHEGFFLAQISPHFFLFPVLIGFLIPYCLVAPAHFLLKRRKLGAKAITALLLFAAYVTYADVKSGDPPPWEYSRILHLDLVELNAHGSEGASARLVRRGAPVEGEAEVARRLPLMQEVHALLDECPELRLTGEAARGVDEHDCRSRRQRFQVAMTAWRDGTEKRWSVTHYAYVVSLFVQVFTFGLSVVCLSLLFAGRQKSREPYLYGLLAFIYFTYFLWLPFRIVALHEKANLYIDVNFLTEAPIVFIVLICYVLTIGLTYKRLRSSLVYVLLSVVGVALVYVAIFYPSWLLHVIGRSSDPLTYPMITMALLLTMFPLVLDSREE